MMRTKYIGVVLLIFATGCSNYSYQPGSSKQGKSSAEETAEKAKLAVIENIDGQIFQIDDRIFSVNRYQNLVEQGIHNVILRYGPWTGTRFAYESKIKCNTIAGHFYRVDLSGCSDQGLTVEAASVFAKEQAEQLKAQEISDKETYQQYKQSLSNSQPPSVAYLKQVKTDLESKKGGFKEDPDHLLVIVDKLLAPHLEEERVKQAKLRSEKEQLAAIAEATRRKRLESKQVGDQVCIDNQSTIQKSTGWLISGQPQYRTILGVTHLVGFVERIEGKRIQIRISGINFSSNGTSEPMENFSNFKGGSTLMINSLIWDSIYDWDKC